MDQLVRFVDAICAIAQEMKISNDLKRQQLLEEEGKRPMGRIVQVEPAPAAAAPVVLPDPNEHKEERERIKARLAELGVPFPAKAGIDRLRRLLDGAEEEAKKFPAAADDPFAAAPATPPAPTQEELRAAIIAAIDAHTAKETAETPELKRQQGAKKVQNLLIKPAGTHKLSEIPVEKYRTTIDELNAAVEALK